MNPTGIILILSIILGTTLSASGAYFIVDNLMQPKGFLFEGIVMLGLGAILILLVVVASALGKTMITFADIMTKQAAIQKQITSSASAVSGPTGIGSIISKMMQNPDSFTVTPMSNINWKEDVEPESYDEKLEQLREELAQAIKEDKYEDAKEINIKIKRIQSLMNGDDDSEDEESDEEL